MEAISPEIQQNYADVLMHSYAGMISEPLESKFTVESTIGTTWL